jgi:spore germination protein GerM
MRRLAVTVLALVVVFAACGEDDVAAPEETPAETPTPTEPPEEEPEATPTPTPTPTAEEEAEGVEEVAVYFAREHDSGVWVEPEVVPLDAPTVGVARAAMEALVGHAPREPERSTLAAASAEVLDADIDGDVLVVDFAGLVDDGLGAAAEEALVQQIAHTGAQFDNVRAVQILVDGEEVESLAGHVGVQEPVEPDPLALSPITFTSHSSGDEVPVGEVTVTGEACTFEATVELEVVDPDGAVVEETFTTATIACPERGEWEHTFTLAEPGTWTIRAIEPDPSGGEGRPPFDVSLELEAG